MLYVNKDLFKKLVIDAETIDKASIINLIDRCTTYDDSLVESESKTPEENKILDELDYYFMTDHSATVRQMASHAREMRLRKEHISASPRIGKWYLNKNMNSLNFERHYCSVCGQYPISYDKCHTLVDFTPAFCPHCGVRNTSYETRYGNFEEVHITA